MAEKLRNSAKRVDAHEIIALSAGRWFGILATFGVKVRQDAKHSPCPLCSGRDRFRMDIDGSGYFCNQCGPGTAISLIMRSCGFTFPEALERINEIVGDIPKQKRRPGMSDAKRREALIQLWKSSVPLAVGDPVCNYLQSRGLKLTPENVRYCATCYNKDENRYMDAMIANFMGPDGKGVTIHRTYLENDRKANIEKPKKLMPHAGEMAGGAVRLFPYKDVLGIAEGIETAIAAAQLFGIPTWAALSAGMLEQWEPPEVGEVIIFGDRDNSYTGQKAAYVLANRLAIKGVNVNVEIPISTGDWADQVEG